MIKKIMNLKYVILVVVVGCGALITPKISIGDDNVLSSDEVAKLQNGGYAQNTQTVRLMFADEEELSARDLEDLAKYEQGIENHDHKVSADFEENKEAKGYETAFDGKEDDLASLKILGETQETINKAKMYHNMKQTLPDIRKTFQELKDTREYHDKTVEYLQQSHECVLSYLSEHYENPSKAWFGDGGLFGQGTVYHHYNPEKEKGDKSASQGLYDDECPDDALHLCYVEKIEDVEYKSGIVGLLSGYYNEGKEQDALQETKTYLNEGEIASETKVGDAYENSYTSQDLIDSREIDEIQDEEKVYVSNRNDPDSMDKDNANVSEILPDFDSVKEIKEADSMEVEESTKDPKAAEALEEETRKSHLMNWIWGAQVASDVSDDLERETSLFGVRKNRFPLWNDQKEFYDQYIDGKYDNIRDYVSKAPMPNSLFTAAISINEIFDYEPIVITDAMGNEKGRIEADEIRDAIGEAFATADMTEFNKDDDIRSAIDKIVEEEDKELNNLKVQHENKLARLISRKETLQEQLALANNDLSDTNDRINENSNIVASSANTNRITEENKEYSDKIQELYKDPIDVSQSPINKRFADEKTDSDINSISAQKNRETELKSVKDKELRSKLLVAELKKVQEEIEKDRREFVKKYSEAEEKMRETFVAKVEKADIVRVEDSAVLAKIENIISDASSALSSQYGAQIVLPAVAASLSGQMMTCLRKEAAKIAEETKAEMNKMKVNESLYLKGKVKQVQNVHRDMIDKMKKISSCSIGGVQSAPVAEKVFGKMCDDINCLEPDTSRDKHGLMSYFVGALALKDDLKSPTPPVEFSSAPVREIFHFDLEDYDALEKYYEDEEDLDNNSNFTITADDFLNSGLEMPLIWKYVLSRHTYGQKQFDLTKLLGNSEFGDEVRGDPDKSYIRSGIFPCYIDNSVIDINPVIKLQRVGGAWALDVERFGYTINMTPDIHIYGKVLCRGFTIEGDKVIDYAVDASPPGDIPQATVNGLISETSELGSVLAFVPSRKADSLLELIRGNDPNKKVINRKLTFNASLQKSIGIISKSEEINDDKEKEAEFYLANRSLFDRNQFGDFLNQFEQEALAREGLRKIENRIGEIRQQLKDMFKGTDVVITEDFDLLNENDYKAASDALDEQKGIYINKAETQLQQVKGFTETVKNRTEKLLHSIAVLEADSEEILQLNGSEDINELKDKIKNKMADTAVVDKYEDEKPAAQELRIRQLQPPYCGVHPYK